MILNNKMNPLLLGNQLYIKRRKPKQKMRFIDGDVILALVDYVYYGSDRLNISKEKSYVSQLVWEMRVYSKNGRVCSTDLGHKLASMSASKGFWDSGSRNRISLLMRLIRASAYSDYK